MAQLSLRNIVKIYDNGTTTVHDFNLDIADKEFVVFVGPSGCGKSTTLRMIAGLEDISSGEFYIDDKLVNQLDSKDRDIAMVFQSYALYPHMTVYDNMAFALKLRKFPKDEIKKRVNEAAVILGLEKYLTRKPKALSGGQRQRVALGRAVVREPKVFLMDEPLSNLDAKLRSHMRSEILKLHRRVGATTIYVTHDQTEAMTMADRIVVMKDGWIQQIDTPKALYDKPINLFVAGFIGSPPMNFIHGRLSGDNALEFGKAKLMVPEHIASKLKKLGYAGRNLTMGVRPESISTETHMLNAHEACIVDVKVSLAELLGHHYNIHFDLGDVPIVSIAPAHDLIHTGDTVKIAFDLSKAHFFDPETENRLDLDAVSVG